MTGDDFGEERARFLGEKGGRSVEKRGSRGILGADGKDFVILCRFACVCQKKAVTLQAEII